MGVKPNVLTCSPALDFSRRTSSSTVTPMVAESLIIRSKASFSIRQLWSPTDISFAISSIVILSLPIISGIPSSTIHRKTWGVIWADASCISGRVASIVSSEDRIFGVLDKDNQLF